MKISKIIALASAALGLTVAQTANAGLVVHWSFIYGMYAGDGTTPVAQNNDVLWQLVFSPDGTADAVDPNNSGAGYVSGDDQVLASRITPTGGNAAFDAYLYENVLSAPYQNAGTFTGNLYIRVFQDTTPAQGELYYNSPVQVAANLNPAGLPPPAPQDIEGNLDPVNGDKLNLTIVPEPGTFVFLGIGGLLLAVRRMRRS